MRLDSFTAMWMSLQPSHKLKSRKWHWRLVPLPGMTSWHLALGYHEVIVTESESLSTEQLFLERKLWKFHFHWWTVEGCLENKKIVLKEQRKVKQFDGLWRSVWRTSIPKGNDRSAESNVPRSICPKTLCSLSPTSMMLHIKFDQDWLTGFRDIRNSRMSGLIRRKIELDQAFLPVLFTSNFDDDSIKNERASMETAFSHYKSMANYLDAQGQLSYKLTLWAFGSGELKSSINFSIIWATAW